MYFRQTLGTLFIISTLAWLCSAGIVRDPIVSSPQDDKADLEVVEPKTDQIENVEVVLKTEESKNVEVVLKTDENVQNSVILDVLKDPTKALDETPVKEPITKESPAESNLNLLDGIPKDLEETPLSETEAEIKYRQNRPGSIILDVLSGLNNPQFPLQNQIQVPVQENLQTSLVPFPTSNLNITHPDFYVITAIFNPASYQKRYDLYHKFAQYMADSGAQLVTIECIFPSLNQDTFQVTDPSNPYHIQLKSESIYWVKENLINIAASRLPSTAKYIAWVDADIEMKESDWIERTISALEQYSVVQMFKMAHFLNAEEEIERTDYSFGYSVVHNKPIINYVQPQEWYPHPGYAWAMSKSTFDQAGGLPDFDIVGGGDLYFAYSLIDQAEYTMDKSFNPEYRNHLIQETHDTYTRLVNLSQIESKALVGYAPVTLNHFWHGSTKDRGYVDRLKILIQNQFNFYTDVERNRDGLLVFIANNTESLQEDIQCYFENRNEDSKTGEDGEKLGLAKCKFMENGQENTASETLTVGESRPECYQDEHSTTTDKNCGPSKESAGQFGTNGHLYNHYYNSGHHDKVTNYFITNNYFNYGDGHGHGHGHGHGYENGNGHGYGNGNGNGYGNGNGNGQDYSFENGNSQSEIYQGMGGVSNGNFEDFVSQWKKWKMISREQ